MYVYYVSYFMTGTKVERETTGEFTREHVRLIIARFDRFDELSRRSGTRRGVASGSAACNYYAYSIIRARDLMHLGYWSPDRAWRLIDIRTVKCSQCRHLYLSPILSVINNQPDRICCKLHILEALERTTTKTYVYTHYKGEFS